MNRYWAVLGSIGVLLVVHIPGAYLTGTGFLFPDLTLVFLILISKRVRAPRAITAGFIAGLVQDVFAGSLLGAFALAKAAACFSAAELHAALSPEHELARITSLVFPAVIHFSLVYALRFSAAVQLPRLILLYLLPPLIVTVCVLLMADAAAARRANRISL